MTQKDLMLVIKALVEQEKADACHECAFLEKEEWEMPCCKCKRNCKDYWRPKNEQ